MTTEELSKLTPEQKRVKIAEICGWKWWKFTRPDGSFFTQLVEPNATWMPRSPFSGKQVDSQDGENPDDSAIPDYLNDLNAAVALCDLLTEKGWTCRMDNRLDKTWECTVAKNSLPLQQHYGCGDTLAQAICDAFLLTK